jgi:hypothetical protein
MIAKQRAAAFPPFTSSDYKPQPAPIRKTKANKDPIL